MPNHDRGIETLPIAWHTVQAHARTEGHAKQCDDVNGSAAADPQDEWSQHQTQLMHSAHGLNDEWPAGEQIDEYELASQQQNESAGGADCDESGRAGAVDEADAALDEGQRQTERVEREGSSNWSDRTKKVMCCNIRHVQLWIAMHCVEQIYI